MSNAIQEIFGTIIYGLHVSKQKIAELTGYDVGSIDQMLNAPNSHKAVFEKVCLALVVEALNESVPKRDRESTLNQVARLKDEFEKLKEPGNNPTPT